MGSGPRLFAEFALPPNALGYCGPGDLALLPDLLEGDRHAEPELAHVAAEFAGAWPYLQLIGEATGREPLDPLVVEAYWIGNPLLEQLDLLNWGNSMRDRFHGRAATEWEAIPRSLELGARPHHSFHVYCVYPWVGLLRSGAVEQALGVLDRCRIRWGRVVAVRGISVEVTTRPLVWDGRHLRLGVERLEEANAPIQHQDLAEGDEVALHWSDICRRLTRSQLRYLKTIDSRHLAIVNIESDQLTRKLES